MMPKFNYADPDKALARAKAIAMRPKHEKLAALLEAHKAKKKTPVQQPLFTLEQIA